MEKTPVISSSYMKTPNLYDLFANKKINGGYYFQKANDNRKGQSLDENTNFNEHKFVVACDYKKKDGKIGKVYFSCKNPCEFYYEMIKLPEHKRNFYEVVTVELNPLQKMRFDIDAQTCEFSKEQVEETVKNIIINTKNIIEGRSVKCINIPNVNFYVFNSSTETKHSYHIILDGYVFAQKELIGIYKNVCERLDSKYRDIVDNSVYKTNQQFRLCMNAKMGKNNYKKRNGFNTNNINISLFEASLIGNYNGNIEVQMNEDIKNEELISSVDIGDYDVDIVVAKANEHFQANLFESGNMSGNIVWLKGTNLYHGNFECPECKRVHTGMNSHVKLYGKKQAMYWFCNRTKDKVKGIYLGDLKPEEKNDEPTPIEKEKYEKIKKEKIEREFNSIIKEYENFVFDNKNIEVKEYRDRYLPIIPNGYKTYYIKSDMGTDKTGKIVRFMHDNNIKSVKSLTFRVNLAIAQKGRFSEPYNEKTLDFKLYNENNYNNDSEIEVSGEDYNFNLAMWKMDGYPLPENLDKKSNGNSKPVKLDEYYEIRQAESLWKLDGQPLPKYLIIDEIYSFMQQMDKGCHGKKLLENREMFLTLLKNCDTVIFADAFLDANTIYDQ
jgi:hypothetical protein